MASPDRAPKEATTAQVGQRTTQRAGGGDNGRDTSPPLRFAHLLRLQRAAGNRAVTDVLAAQRVPVPVDYSEVLHQNATSGTSSFVPTEYSISTTSPSRSSATGTRPSRYQLTRGRSSANVEVRIKFVDPVSGRTGVGAELPPESATDTRRSNASTVCRNLTSLWNNKFRFVASRQDPVAGVPQEADSIELPLRFTATPVFDIDAEADAEVNLHLGQAGAGNAFDAGNYYRLSSNGLPPPLSTYAHEYGHLIGLPDEYNQSNAQAHLILHDAAEGVGAPSAGPAMARRLDDATRRLMVLQSVEGPLRTAINGIVDSVQSAFAGQRGRLSSQLTQALRTAWRNQATIDALVSTYTEGLSGVSGSAQRLPRVTAFQARDNLSYRTIAKNAVDSVLSPDSFRELVRAAYTNAITSATRDAQRILVNVAEDQSPVSRAGTETMDLSIETIGVSGTDSALDTAAQQIAEATTGAPPPAPSAPTGGGAAPASPPALTPSTTLLGALRGLPATWSSIPALFATEAAALPEQIQTVASELAAMPGLTDGGARALYRYMYQEIQLISGDTARTAVNSFVTRQVTPHLNAQIEQIIEAVQAEPGCHTTVTASGATDGSADVPPPDPALMDVALTMQQRLNSMMQTATAGASHVRYDVNSLMGQHRQGTSIRTEQLDGIRDEFNAQFRRPDETEFETRPVG